MLDFLGRVGQQEADLGTAIQALAAFETADGHTVIWTVSGAGGGVGAWRVTESGSVERIDTARFPASSGLSPALSDPLSLQAGDWVAVAGRAGTVVSYGKAADGSIGGRTEMTLSGASTVPVALVQAENGAVFAAHAGSQAVASYMPAGADGLELRAQAEVEGGPVSALATAFLDGAEFLIVANDGDSALTSYEIGTGGSLSLRAVFGAEQGLTVAAAITDLETLSAHGRTYVLVASAPPAGSAGTISVLRLETGGNLRLVDHVHDTRESRFGGIQSLSVLERDGEVLVLAGGGDDGLSLFSLLPGGRLVHRDTVEHETGFGLENVSDTALFAHPGGVGAVVVGQGAPGLSLFGVARGAPGLVREAPPAGGAVSGGGRDDQLMGGAGSDTLSGGAGADILFDGAGSDWLDGGAGRDTFVLVRDGAHDTILNFELGQDRIDLSFVPMLYDPGSVMLESTAFGARMTFGADVTDIYSAAGGPLDVTVLRAAIEIAVNRPAIVARTGPIPTPEPDPEILLPPPPQWDFRPPEPEPEPVFEPPPVRGPDLDQPFVPPPVPPSSVPEEPDLAPGPDLSPLPGKVLLGRARDDRLSGGARDDRIEGRGGNDHLTGGDRQDTLKGGAGNDTLIGDDGWDLLLGGAGRDSLDGGAGNDTLKGGRHADTLVGGNGDDVLAGGSDDDLLDGLDGRDVLRGGKGFDMLRGGAGEDTLSGGGQNDTLLGGEGDDTLSGGAGNDWLEGGAGDDVLRGQKGADSFVFRPGEGADVIVDFGGGDVLVLEMAARPLRALIDRADADGLWLTWEGGGVLLEGLSAGDLDRDDVIFV